jgi:hypothetical protein
MASYKLPEPRNMGPKVEDLKGLLLAIQPSEVGVRETKYGEKLVATARVVQINLDGSTEDLGETRFAQQVLAEDLQAVLDNGHGWLVGRVIRPDRAWLFEPPDESELELIDEVMAKLTDPSDGF